MTADVRIDCFMSRLLFHKKTKIKILERNQRKNFTRKPRPNLEVNQNESFRRKQIQVLEGNQRF